MPIYEFHCTSCGTDFEELVLGHAAHSQAAVVCCKCGGSQVVKKMSRFAAGASSSSPGRGGASDCAPSG